MFKKLLLSLLLVFVFIFSACSEEIPTSVYFKNATSAGSSNYTFSVVHLQDKTMQNFYTDIYFKTNKDDVIFSLALEGKEPLQLYVSEGFIWQSLTEMINNQTDTKVNFNRYKETLNKTFIINVDKAVTFTFKGVIGDYNEQTNSLINLHDSSKKFKLTTKSVQK